MSDIEQREETQQIIDASDLRKYRTELPNLYDDAGLDVFEFRLLAHYKRVGNCWESTRTTATRCKMSAAQVCIKRQSLAEKGFITITVRQDETPLIKVIDRWLENFTKYCSPDERECLSGKHECLPRKQTRLPRKLKNKPIEEGTNGRNNGTSITRDIQARYVQLLGYDPGDWAAGESKAAKAIADTWTPDQLEYAYRHFKSQPFWSDKRLTLAYLKKQMPELFKNGNGNGIQPTRDTKAGAAPDADRVREAVSVISARARAAAGESMPVLPAAPDSD